MIFRVDLPPPGGIYAGWLVSALVGGKQVVGRLFVNRFCLNAAFGLWAEMPPGGNVEMERR